jgi:hypothetical protein
LGTNLLHASTTFSIAYESWPGPDGKYKQLFWNLIEFKNNSGGLKTSNLFAVCIDG